MINASFSDYPVTQPITLEASNLAFANLVNPDLHPVHLINSNIVGLRQNSTLLEEPLPPNITLGDYTRLHPIAQPPVEPRPLQLAKDILKVCEHWLAIDGITAWLHGVSIILTDPNITYEEVTAQHNLWARLPENNNLVDWEYSLQTLWANFFTGLTWPQLVAKIHEYSLEVWSGQSVL